jgi:broad specificity phosphatase PhoE
VRLYIVRHAEPDYANDALTARGRLEAAALAEYLSTQQLTHIECSTMGRAKETALFTAEKIGLAPRYHDALCELDWHTQLDGWGRLSAWDVPGEILRAIGDSDAKSTEIDARYVAPFRDGIEEIRSFSDDFLEAFGYRREGGRYEQIDSNRCRIAVVCHGGLALTLLAHLLGMPLHLFWCGFWLPPSSVTTIAFEERSPGWAVPRCIGVGDVSHLQSAGLSVSPMGLHGES